MTEQFPTGSEHDPFRPQLDIDFSGPDGNVYMVVTLARAQLQGDALDDFNADVYASVRHGSGKTYTDVLAIVNTYVDILDTSNIYPQYGAEAHITAAVNALNAELHLLPPGIESEVTGLYPEFNKPELGPDKYGLLLEEEIRRVEGEVERAKEDTVYDWLNLQNRLRDTVAALRRAGVIW